MPDTKITALAAITTVAPANDLFAIVDVSDNSMAASGTTKNITTNQILGAGGTATLASATITGDLTVDTSTLKVDSTNNRVGIGTATPARPLDIVGSFQSSLGWVLTGTPAGLGAATRYIGGASTTDSWYYNGLTGGSHIWAFGESTAMTLNSTGLGVGGSHDTGLLTVGATTITSATTPSMRLLSNKATLVVTADGATNAAGTTINYSWANGGQGPLIFRNASIANVMTLDSSGNVGIGVTPSAWATYKAVSVGGIGASVFGLGSSQAGVAQGAFFNNGAGSGWAYSATSQVPTYYLQINGENIWNIAASGTAGAQITAWTPAMKLDANGNLILQSSATPATLATNGQLTVNATSNTNLRFSYRGSDGTTRVANLTLA